MGDLDKDGWQDLILTTPSGLRIYRNNVGRGFTDMAPSVGLGQSPKAITLADVNGDRWLDVIKVTGGKFSVVLNTNVLKRVLHLSAIRVLGGRR